MMDDATIMDLDDSFDEMSEDEQLDAIMDSMSQLYVLGDDRTSGQVITDCIESGTLQGIILLKNILLQPCGVSDCVQYIIELPRLGWLQ